MSTEIVVSILSFVVNSAVLTSFIIPQAQKLKEIRDSLFQLPLHEEESGNQFATRTFESKQLDLNSIERIQSILDSYRVRAAELRPFYWIFGTSIALAIAAVAILAVSNLAPAVVVTAHLICQLLALLMAVRVHVVNPERLTDASQLVAQSDLNPHMLVRAMMIAPSLESARDRREKYERSDPLVIRLGMRLRLTGFRFLYIVSGLDGRVFFVSFGPVCTSAHIWRQLALPQHGVPETSWVSAGKCRFNALPGATQEVRLLVFLPFFRHERIHPMLGSSTLEIGAQRREVIGGYTGGIGALNTDRVYRGVICRGVGARLHELTLDPGTKERDPVIDRVIKRYGRDICRARRIRQFETLQGLAL